MDRRTFMGTAVAGLGVVVLDRRAWSAAQEASEAVPQWLTHEPLIIVGNWDSMPIFRRRVGGNPTWQEDDYRRESSEAVVRELKELGVTMAILHFYKGFGLEAEKEHIEVARHLAALLKKYGIRVGLYVGSTIAYETFLLEKPEAEEWFVPDYLGQPVFYDNHTFRKRVYFMHPGYLEYMKRVVRMGVEELGADDIDFDNTSMQAHPEIFQHPLAIEHFRDYLKSHYSAEELKRRLGFSDVRYVLPPKYERPLSVIDDPLFQMWTDFRCRQLNRYYAEMYALIRSLNPRAVVSTNPHSGISGENTIWRQGINYPELLKYMDIVWTEEGDYAGVNADGVLVSKIRTYKMAARLDKSILTYTAGSEGGGKLAMAESMAFNRQALGMVGDMFAGERLPEDQRSYIRFFRENFQYYRDVRNIPDAALLYSYATMGFNNDRPAVSFMLLGQVLIQGRVPFDLIFDEHLKDLSRYRVLILADQECLDEDQMNLIRQFVQSGGGLVATEHTSLYTPWRERRPDFGLKDLFQVAAATWQGARRPEQVLGTGPLRPWLNPTRWMNQWRVSYIPDVEPAVQKPPAARMTSEYWKLPLNWTTLLDEIRWAAGGPFSLEVLNVEEPLLVTELVEQKAERRLLVHLLNYDAERGSSLKNPVVNLRIPKGDKVSKVTVLSPDDGKTTQLEFSLIDGRVVFTVPEVHTYSLVVVQLATDVGAHGNAPKGGS